MPRRLRRPCPVCERTVSVSHGTGTVYAHGPAVNRCPGTGQRIDPYGVEE